MATNDFLFNSSFNYQKIAMKDSTPITAGGADTTQTLTTGVTGTPDFRVFVEQSGVRRLWGTQANELAFIDSGSLKVYVPGGMGSLIFHWRIYA